MVVDRLGVRDMPVVGDVLRLLTLSAVPTAPAWTYFASNFDYFRSEYGTANKSFAFIPSLPPVRCKVAGAAAPAPILCKPTEVYETESPLFPCCLPAFVVMLSEHGVTPWDLGVKTTPLVEYVSWPTRDVCRRWRERCCA